MSVRDRFVVAVDQISRCFFAKPDEQYAGKSRERLAWPYFASWLKPIRDRWVISRRGRLHQRIRNNVISGDRLCGLAGVCRPGRDRVAFSVQRNQFVLADELERSRQTLLQ